MKKPPGGKCRMIPYGSKIIRAQTYEEDDNSPNKTRERNEVKKEIKKEIDELDKE